MTKFTEANYPGLLGVTGVCRISDREIWGRLLSPITKGLLGPITGSRDPVVMETVKGLFPGDEVTNLNNHQIFGSLDFVRFPYTHNFYKTQNGVFIVKRDGIKMEATAWFGDAEAGRGELIFKAGLRDRCYDGTKRANDTALLDYEYDDPVLNRRLSTDLKSIEMSVYAFMPGSKISDAIDDGQYELFVRQPFAFVKEPDKFLRNFNLVWLTRRAPGQHATPIPDVSNAFLEESEKLAGKYGYDVTEMAPSHYHVAKWGIAKNYVIVDRDHERAIHGLTDGLERIRATGYPLTRSQQSWVCVLQSLPAEAIPAHLRIEGLAWPQNNLTKECLWLYKPVSAKGEAFRKSCLRT